MIERIPERMLRNQRVAEISHHSQIKNIKQLSQKKNQAKSKPQKKGRNQKDNQNIKQFVVKSATSHRTRNSKCNTPKSRQKSSQNIKKITPKNMKPLKIKE